METEKIAIAGNQSTTYDVLMELMDSGYDISYLINVGPKHQSKIADYLNLKDASNKFGIQLLRPFTYEMDDSETESLFDEVEIDLVISVGWQRLFPPWFLDSLSIGAFGMHGSADPLPKGRGRSPMNWSIIEDRDRFITNLFKYDEDIDSGKIVDNQIFNIFPWDTIRSLQHKNATAQVQLLLENLPDLLNGTANLTSQPEDVEPTYYPKRVPDDGVIDWRDTAERIHRLVRAVTKPYPGAFTFSNMEDKIFVWQGHPFDKKISFEDAELGEIVEAYHDTTFVVKTAEFSFYVLDWETDSNWTPLRGEVLVSQENPSWDKLARMGQ